MHGYWNVFRPASLCGVSAPVCALLLAVGVVGCTPPSQPLRVGANIWVGSELLFIAADTKRSGKSNIRVFSFLSGVDVMRAYRNGVIDVATVTGDEALLLVEQDADHRIILVCDYSHGGDMILARQEVQSLKDLRGRRIAVESGALGAFVLSRALSSVGLKPEDATILTRDPQSLESAYVKDRVDAVVAYEPVASRIEAMGARRLLDSSQMPGEIADLLITRRSLIEARPDALQALVEAWFKARERYEREPKEVARQVAAMGRVGAEEFLANMQGLKLVDRIENVRLLGSSSRAIVADLVKIQSFMQEQKLLTHAPDLDALPEGQFVEGRVASPSAGAR